MSLTSAERRTLDALLERMYPGALAIGAGAYVAGALAGPYAAHLTEYRALCAALDAAAGGGFADADAAAADAVVARLEARALPGLADSPERSSFDLVWRHLREGLFGDPSHGGNRDMAGWRAIGFPGAQFGYRVEEQEVDAPIERAPQPLSRLPRAARLRDPPDLATNHLAAPGGEADVVIIGGGLVGALVAHRLVMAGSRVVILEAGPKRGGREHVMDELSATAFRNLGGASKFAHEVPTWRRNEAEVARPATLSQGLETALGGNSVAWGAVAMRFHEDDFRVRSATVDRYGEAAVPAGSTLADWPLRYDDLAPYYDAAETVLGVSGQAGANPFEAPRAGPYAMPPLRTSGLGARFARAARARGHRPFPLPAAILTQPREGRHACTYCSFCSRFGCHVDAKASAQNTVLDEALATGRLRVVTGATVTAIVTDESGRAVAARYHGADGEATQAGGAIVLAAYSFENTRLLLLSRDPRHRRGVGNETGQVGRHYITRQQPSVYAVFDGARLNRFTGPTAQAMAIADLSADHFDHTGLGFIRGGRIAAFNQYLPVEASGVLPPEVPRWGAAWRDFFTAAYNSTAMLFIDPEILPYQTNYLDLDPNFTDRLGRPVARVTFDIGDNERRLIAHLQDEAERIALGMGATRTWRRAPLTGPISTHDVGGTRMGNDPAVSVVDGFGRVHDTPGLVVLGGSTFVSLPAVNPSLTIAALALRAADRMLRP